MKKLSISVISTVLVCLMFVASFSASALKNNKVLNRVVDNAGLMSSEEVKDIEAKLTELRNKYDMDIVIVTVDSTEDKTKQEFADDYFDYNGYGEETNDDGLLLLIDMDESDRGWYISTKGQGIPAFTDAGIQYIGNQIKELLSDGEYYEAFSKFTVLCDDFIEKYNAGTPYDTNTLPKDPFNVLTAIIFSAIVSVSLAFIIVNRMKSKLKSVRFKAEANDYEVAGSFHLAFQNDRFLYSHVDRRLKPKNNGGGSSTHSSSSGSTHGGGGGSF